jgi:hypothetical protein
MKSKQTKLLEKLQEKHVGSGTPAWFKERKYPKMPLMQRAGLRIKRIALYEIW